MLGKENLTQKIIRFCNDLPDCCTSFLLETGTEMANSTRLAYARELDWFFDYLVNYNPDFAETAKRKITIQQIRGITSQDISRYLTIYKGQGKAERTLARKRAALSRFFTYLTDNRQIDFNPVAAAVRVKIHQSDDVLHLNMAEQVRFLDAYYDNKETIPATYYELGAANTDRSDITKRADGYAIVVKEGDSYKLRLYELY